MILLIWVPTQSNNNAMPYTEWVNITIENNTDKDIYVGDAEIIW